MKDDLTLSLEELSSLNKELLSLAGRIMKADEGKMFPLDIMTIAVINRAFELAEGFKLLIEERKFLCAAPLLRLQLDNLLRYSAVWLVDSPHHFCMEVFKGTPVKNIKDRSGKKMMDFYLVDKLATDVEWIKSVYEKTCGYVHFSESHFHKVITSVEDDGKVTMGVGEYSKPVPDENLVEAVSAFCAATTEIYKYAYDWLKTKDGSVDLSGS